MIFYVLPQEITVGILDRMARFDYPGCFGALRFIEDDPNGTLRAIGTAVDPSVLMRFGEYKGALILIERYPLFGVGFTGTPDLDIYLGVSMLYLIIAENMGIIGLALFAAACTLARRVIS